MKRYLAASIAAIVLLGTNIAFADSITLRTSEAKTGITVRPPEARTGNILQGSDLLQSPRHPVRPDTRIHVSPEIIVVLPKRGHDEFYSRYHGNRAGAPWEPQRRFSPPWNQHGLRLPHPPGQFKGHGRFRGHRALR